MAVRKKTSRFLSLLLVAVAGVMAWAVYSYLTLPEVGSLAARNPSTTALIELRMAEAREKRKKLNLRRKWVDYASCSKTAIDAVIVSEDATFFIHQGIDYDELQNALQQSLHRGTLVRGASTITQQLAKNLWLSNERSLLRKAKELILAKRLEDHLSKKRILTLYLNVAEWGDGIFGIEAAAQNYFGVSTKELSTAQAVMLASMLPSPRKWTPSRRSPALMKRSVRLLDRLVKARKISSDEALKASTDLDLFFRKPNDPTEPVEDEGDDA